ncbi:hypothetical protein [Lysobacter silvisoli]|uniref:Uncharacterized protein n=1 Tax=Lysobacter silvisoli TaxID=2293254 RepID=A0A371K354_9GAMM|nr:hypothetical protein [Lysobacter silvisoli]RDZ28312.1 hypothetical protein DX914_03990 [Lysobacter silvisoli]
MTSRNELLALLRDLDDQDPDHFPLVTLDQYFSQNDQEDSIAPNQWGYGRPPLRELYARLKAIEARADVQGIYVGLHQEWGEALDDDELWPAAENVHVYSSAPPEVADSWIEGLESDGISEGWPYGKHAASPEPPEGYRVYTIYWD